MNQLGNTPHPASSCYNHRPPGNLLSLRNLILGRCLNIALSLPKLTHSIVSLATSVSGQSVMDNLSHEYALDTALAAVHLFCSCSDATLLRKNSRLAVLVAMTVREAELRLPERECLATSALIMLIKHLQDLRAIGPEAVRQSSMVRAPSCAAWRFPLLMHSRAKELCSRAAVYYSPLAVAWLMDASPSAEACRER
jgi:hypothetical protein